MTPVVRVWSVGGMELVINGERKTVRSTTLQELLEELEVLGLRCATMVNGRIVRRTDRATTQLAPGDGVEIITMVGGG